MTELLYDAVDPANIPSTAQAVMGYVDGPESEWPASGWDRFAGASLIVRLTVLGFDASGNPVVADGADVETGDLTPESGARWAKQKHDVLHQRPLLYCNKDTWPAVRAAVVNEGLQVSDVDWGIADWGPAPGQGIPHLLPGTAFTQYDHDLAPGYDVSQVVDGWAPSQPTAQEPAPPVPNPPPAPPAPPPAPPASPEVDVQLPVLSNQGNGPYTQNAAAVETVQRAVGAGVDGKYGPGTTAAVEAFQRAHSLQADGITGNQTWTMILLGQLVAPGQ